jgi:hypothetical protein
MRSLAASLLSNAPFASWKVTSAPTTAEVDWMNGKPAATSTRFGIGRAPG